MSEGDGSAKHINPNRRSKVDEHRSRLLGDESAAPRSIDLDASCPLQPTRMQEARRAAVRLASNRALLAVAENASCDVCSRQAACDCLHPERGGRRISLLNADSMLVETAQQADRKRVLRCCLLPKFAIVLRVEHAGQSSPVRPQLVADQRSMHRSDSRPQKATCGGRVGDWRRALNAGAELQLQAIGQNGQGVRFETGERERQRQQEKKQRRRTTGDLWRKWRGVWLSSQEPPKPPHQLKAQSQQEDRPGLQPLPCAYVLLLLRSSASLRV